MDQSVVRVVDFAQDAADKFKKKKNKCIHLNVYIGLHTKPWQSQAYSKFDLCSVEYTFTTIAPWYDEIWSGSDKNESDKDVPI